jgi:chromate transporter
MARDSRHRGFVVGGRHRRAIAAGTCMNIFLLYLLLLKGTITAFAGLASLPVVQDALVIQHHVLTDTQLNEAVVITRSTPGPVGLYIVSVGYFVAGLPGAIAGWLAMITPALLIIPLVHFVGRKMEHPRVKSILQTVVIASAGLLLAAAIPLAKDALTGPVTIGIAAASLVLLLTTKLDTLWIILGAAVTSLSASALGVMGGII